MQIEELVTLSSQKVRRSPDLMAIYIESFKKTFGKTPNCAGCTFSSDFIKLKNAVLKHKPTKKTNQMEKQTFKLKRKLGKIHSYKKNGRTIHFYDTNMTEEIAVDYLTYGTEEQIEKRKDLFSILPNIIDKKAGSIEVKDLKDVDDELVIIGDEKFTVEKALEFLEEAGHKTKATSVKGIQKFVDNLKK